MEEQSQEVTRRRVFFVPGYDPHPARRYRELYRTEAAKQGEISDYKIAVKALMSRENYAWRVGARFGSDRVISDVEVLEWRDIVRRSMGKGIVATYGQLFRTAWTYLSTGVLPRLIALRRSTMVAGLYPAVVLLLQLLVGIIIAGQVGGFFADIAGPGVGWITAPPIIALTLRWFRSIDSRFYAYYLMHDFAFAARWRGAYAPEVEERLEAFKETVAEAMQSEVDEVLIVGHSSGAQLSVSLAADLIRGGHVSEDGPKLALLTLGQSIPAMSFLPKATRLRSDLHLLGESDDLTWIDVSAPGDGASFALADPVAVTGLATKDQRWPLVLSAAFSETLSPDLRKLLKWKFFRLHIQYLCAYDQPRDYDYFQITGGPLTLATRFEGRKPSPSRIDIAVSPYRAMIG